MYNIRSAKHDIICLVVDPRSKETSVGSRGSGGKKGSKYF